MTAAPRDPTPTAELPDLAAALALFDIPGSFTDGERLGTGHIHRTYAVHAGRGSEERRYCLQAFNEEVFRGIDAVMTNIRRVCAHLRAKVEARGGDPERETLTLVPARDGGGYARDAAGVAWRAFTLVEGASAWDAARTPRDAREAARGFGRFVRDLEDLPGPRLEETIPGFHDTPARLAALETAAVEDPRGRATEVAAELDFLRRRAADAGRVVTALRAGTLPERVIHNDTKINNVLLDDATGEGLCVIDLDTVMPGSFLFDFGDAVRAGAARCAEDDPDPSRAGVDLERFRALSEGYMSSLGGTLTPTEVEWMPFACELLALELGARFLTDHLRGDVYFRASRPGQNLDRCRVQLAMVRDLEGRREELAGIVAAARSRA